MLFRHSLSKCGSFPLHLPGQVVFTPHLKDPEISAPWPVTFLLIPCADVPLVSCFQVSEVLSEEKSRLSISGWFHGPSLTRPPNYFEPLMPRSPHIPQDVRINSYCQHCFLSSFSISCVFLVLKLAIPDNETGL